jgi:hypothetical protein
MTKLKNISRQEQITIYKNELKKLGVDERSFLIWSAEGINSEMDYSKYNIDDLYNMNLDYDESEDGGDEHMTEEKIKQYLETMVPMFKEDE